ncbi:MAG: bacillithiol biosynthesis deacetylase BshB1 [bacterium]
MKQTETVDLLSIAAHPDDVELSCAGTILLAKKAGKRTAIVDLTRGELSTRGTPELRAQETIAASKILGLDARVNLGLSDGNIEVTQGNVLKLVREIRKFQPAIMLTPHAHERHPDHEAASELAKRASFYAGLAKIETVDDEGNPQKPHRPKLVMNYMQTYTFEPKIIIDVSEVYSERLRAVHAYDSQFGIDNSGRKIASKQPETFLTQSGFYEWIEGKARHYGMMIGAEYGEPFWTYEPLGVQDIFSLVTKKMA